MWVISRRRPARRCAAVAEGHITMRASTLQLVTDGKNLKGDVLATARIAGIMAAKKTPELIPLCHPIPISGIELELETRDTPAQVYCRASARTRGQTGIEMEALTAVQIALLTVYDMCKAVDRGMEIRDVRLLSKSGGRSGDWQQDS